VRYFGTDGIRGKVGHYPITPDFILKFGYALGITLREKFSSPSIVIGKDTRISGYLFESALEAGLTYAGVNVYLVGPIPTPAVAYITRAFRLSAGCVISASHNPYTDNGIKIFSNLGYKIDQKFEERIEELINHEMTISEQLGYVYRIDDAKGRYIEFCKSAVPNYFSLQGKTIVIDCAHGATYQIAPYVFEELGAQVMAIGITPDGMNINQKCGATHVNTLLETTLAAHADYGIAFDGDGDRVIITDKYGNIYDGDKIVYIIAKLYKKLNINFDSIVGTILTNLGLENALAQSNIKLIRAGVGDKNIAEQIKNNKLLIGGEPSGHIIVADKHTTGDGIIAALLVLYACYVLNQDLNEIIDWEQVKQINHNIPIEQNRDWQIKLKNVLEQIDAVAAKNGRVLIRESGTESVLRIMIESDDENFLNDTWLSIQAALNN
jgi:phosphoglucosamine mutase